MKITEIILDGLNDTRLFEMAFTRKQALEKFRQVDYVIAEHLIKVLAFNSPNTHNHWCSEINAFIKPLVTVKWDGNKKLSKKDILSCLFKGYLENGESDVQNIIDNIEQIDGLKSLRNSKSAALIHGQLIRIYDIISDNLSLGKAVPIQEILTQVESKQ